MDYPMMCETLARKIFQCGRFDDPLGIANTDRFHKSHDNESLEEQKCQAWVLLKRLQNQYLDSVINREILLEQSHKIELNILNATTDKNIYDSMFEINEIVNQLNISEFPHIDYRQTNDIK